MTGRDLIDSFFIRSAEEEKETVKEDLSFYLEYALFAISDGKLDLDTELTRKDMENLIKFIDKNYQTEEMWNVLADATNIVDSDVLKFFAEYPNYLKDVEDVIKGRSSLIGQPPDRDLLGAFKCVFMNFVAERLLDFRDYTLQDAVKKARQQEEKFKEEER